MSKKEDVLEQFETKKEPRKTLQTYLRNQNKLQVNSFNIIDRKAAIMIRINSTIISLIVIFFDRVSELPLGTYIGVILVISSFFSLFFALNASRPHSFDALFSIKKNIKKRKLKPEERIYMPGSSTDLTEEDYEKAFDKVIKSQKLQIGNQVRSVYMFEKFIRKAFIHIELSYLIFMIGFIAITILFVVGNLMW